MASGGVVATECVFSLFIVLSGISNPQTRDQTRSAAPRAAMRRGPSALHEEFVIAGACCQEGTGVAGAQGSKNTVTPAEGALVRMKVLAQQRGTRVLYTWA